MTTKPNTVKAAKTRRKPKALTPKALTRDAHDRNCPNLCIVPEHD
jgi:hypothetical protein